MPVFKRLTQHFKRRFVEFRQFITEEHTIMSQGNLARHGFCATTAKRHLGNRMVWTAERALRDKRRLGSKFARYTVYLRRLKAL